MQENGFSGRITFNNYYDEVVMNKLCRTKREVDCFIENFYKPNENNLFFSKIAYEKYLHSEGWLQNIESTYLEELLQKNDSIGLQNYLKEAFFDIILKQEISKLIEYYKKDLLNVSKLITKHEEHPLERLFPLTMRCVEIEI